MPIVSNSTDSILLKGIKRPKCKNEIDCYLYSKYPDNPCFSLTFALGYEYQCLSPQGACKNTPTIPSYCSGCIPNFKTRIMQLKQGCTRCKSIKCFEASYLFSSCQKLKNVIMANLRYDTCTKDELQCQLMMGKLVAAGRNFIRNDCTLSLPILRPQAAALIRTTSIQV